MALRKQPARESVPATLPSQRAIELLRKQLARIDEIKRLQHGDPEITKWVLTTENILHGAFGKPDGVAHENTREFTRYRGSLCLGLSDGEIQQDHVTQTLERKAILESIVEQLELLAPPAAQVAPGQYQFHPEIERVSGELFRDGHFKHAALEAYIRVIEEVKRRSGIDDDGDSLKNEHLGATSKLQSSSSTASRAKPNATSRGASCSCSKESLA